jgi:hypothetical protein
MTKQESTAKSSSAARTFSEAEYSENAGKIVAHAAANGTAVVSAPDGTARVVISIPTADLPTLGD